MTTLSRPYQHFSSTVERHAHRLEGCECHREIWTSHATRKRKLANLCRATGHSKCHMKGRQAVWLQAEGYDLLIAELYSCSSTLLQELIAAMPSKNENLVRLSTELVEALVEELQDKLGFHFELPYKVIRIYWGEIKGGSTVRSKEFAKEAMTEYDKMIQAGRGAKLHRVSILILGPGICRQQLQQFVDTDLPLSAFPTAYLTIKRYALIMIVGRRVEAAHAELKRIGNAASNIRPPLICATLREPIHLGMLKSSPEFRQFVLEQWRSRSIFNEVLNLVMSQSELDKLSRLGKLNVVYQCGLSSEFQDIHVEQQAHEDFLAHTVSHRRGGPRQVPQSWSLAITYLKAKFQPHIVFSLPRLLYNLLLEAPREGEFDTGLVCPGQRSCKHAHGSRSCSTMLTQTRQSSLRLSMQCLRRGIMLSCTIWTSGLIQCMLLDELSCHMMCPQEGSWC